MQSTAIERMIVSLYENTYHVQYCDGFADLEHGRHVATSLSNQCLDGLIAWTR
jgi:hypothetical protein